VLAKRKEPRDPADSKILFLTKKHRQRYMTYTGDVTQGKAVFKCNIVSEFGKLLRKVGIDRKGVGKLMRIGTELGRQTRPDLKVGICGEHGGNPSSIEFCNEINLNYVSASPYRVPIARLAAAHAALESVERDK
jgi:phosphoenolpyruvate synthase/pyruvate phosphate dikinase